MLHLPVEVDPRITARHPDFAVLVLTVRGADGGLSDPESIGWLTAAERSARASGSTADPAGHPHLAAWRAAYRAFGAKPQRTRCSAEALLRRAGQGDLPAVNRLVDAYNAVSVRHVLPVGGEDLTRFAGTLRLTVATGSEPFLTVEGGRDLVDHPEPGEVVWVDDAGVTCRRWNWRQSSRTRITPATTDAVFLLERLGPLPITTLEAAAAELTDRFGTGAEIRSVRLGSSQ